MNHSTHDRWIDTNVSLGQWPFRRIFGDSLEQLLQLLRNGRVTQAWVGHYDSLLHRDVAAVNERLVAACRATEVDMLLPFGLVNPALPDWEDDLRRCHEVHGMRGIRLYPSCGPYRLDDPNVAALIANATQRHLLVQIVVCLEDERTQHPIARFPHVDLNPLPRIIAAIPKARVQLLNAFRSITLEDAASRFRSEQFSFETAMLEGVQGVRRAIDRLGCNRMHFGSHSPFFQLDSALLKLQESELNDQELQAVRGGNSERLMARRT